MSFQAYLDNIEAKTGKQPKDIADQVRQAGLSKPSDIVAWLKKEFGLGHGHAMAIVALVRRADRPPPSIEDKVDAYFAGGKAKWRPAFDRLVRDASRFGPDTTVAPAASYLSLLKSGRKFAIVQATRERLDLGLKLKGTAAHGRLENAGPWNAMVTHRIRIESDAQLDQQVLGWLKQAHAGA